MGSSEPDRGQGVRWGAVHPMGSSTPGQNGCNAYRSGVAPSPTSTTEAHCRLPLDVCRSAGHEAPSRLVGQSAVRAGAMARGVSAWIAVLRVRCRVGYRRGARCVRVRWLRCRALPARAGWIGGCLCDVERGGASVWIAVCAGAMPRGVSARITALRVRQ